MGTLYWWAHLHLSKICQLSAAPAHYGPCLRDGRSRQESPHNDVTVSLLLQSAETRNAGSFNKSSQRSLLEPVKIQTVNLFLRKMYFLLLMEGIRFEINCQITSELFDVGF